jgi:drug/metabolite transporter (DMT)-like permease
MSDSSVAATPAAARASGPYRAMTAADWLRLIALSIMWGGGYFLSQVVLREVPPFTGSLARIGLAAITLYVYLIATRTPLPSSPRLWGTFIVLGFTNNAVPFTLYFLAQTQINSSLTSILNATAPIFAVVVAHFATRDEKLTRAKALGVVIGFAGVIIMIGPDLLQDLGSHVTAELMCLCAAASYAVGTIFARRLRGTPAGIIAAGQLTVATVMMAAITALFETPWAMPVPSPTVIAALVTLGVVCTALPYFLYYRVLATAGATNVLLVTFMSPVSTILLGMLILSEQLTPRQIAGMVIIFVGLAVIDGRLWRGTVARLHGK